MQDILGVGKTKWGEIVKNAEACKLTDQLYWYNDYASGDNLVLDCAFNIKSVTFCGQTSQLYESLDFTQKEKAGKLRIAAYDKRNELPILEDSTNLVQAGPAYLSNVQQQVQEEQQQIVTSTTASVQNSGFSDGNYTSFANENLPLQVTDYEQEFSISMTAESGGLSSYPSYIGMQFIHENQEQRFSIPSLDSRQGFPFLISFLRLSS
ncbi:uncharacterized protein [Spinacia oleracea]|uniref:Uncharacterized protein isoform X4 n=1 Tax=Spinacia oleracea TaxID=3562 RepID=A0ABM3QH07_SPIOL|nr:uncharacterized protein LOC110779730 isoform X4 [Spinacia oleracea]